MICLIQARMSSKRLPGKIMKRIGNYEIYYLLYKRLIKSKFITDIYFVTSTDESDDVFCKNLKKKKIKFFRGSLNNVALRFLDCSKLLKINFFIRICCDSPFINWKTVDMMILKSKNKKFDLFTNSLDKYYIKGSGIEIVNVKSLKNKIQYFTASQKEHVTKYFYDFKSVSKIYQFKLKKKLKYENFCIDNLSDFKRLNKYVGKRNPLKILDF